MVWLKNGGAMDPQNGLSLDIFRMRPSKFGVGNCEPPMDRNAQNALNLTSCDFLVFDVILVYVYHYI